MKQRPARNGDEVLITEELYRRPPRAPDSEAESWALGTLARELAADPSNLLQKLTEAVVECCRAESAGTSILEKAPPGAQDPGERRRFRWHAVAGAFAGNAGGGLAWDFAPCTAVVERDATLLFDRPGRWYEQLRACEPRVLEALLVPFHVDGEAVGTVWALTHTEGRRFDCEDARVLENLSQFASAGYKLSNELHWAQVHRDELEQRVRERTSELEHAYEQQRDLARRLRRYANELTEAEHRERKRIAAVLHDDLQQLLVAARMQLGRAQHGDRDRQESGALIDQALETSRTLTERLRPPALYEAGLLAALRWLCDDVARRHGMEVELVDYAGDIPVNEDVTALLFEAVRELLFNVAKYAGVERATVEARRETACLRVTVTDSGEGFDAGAGSREQPGGFGLFSVRERLDALGGNMLVDSAPGRGTTVHLDVPA